ncbi:InlB B-repeat-containing protein, partial [Erysipelotrichaceae bacterium OttesenSCG-928-M19]|nr:InlB B-repeat-containing protein [Erysipelotrichaceae bacterium OttesenSCG-928-M19]
MNTLKLMNKKVLVGLAVLALLIGGLVFSSGVNANTNTQDSNILISAYENGNRKISSSNIEFKLEDKYGNTVRENIKTSFTGGAVIKDVSAGEYYLVKTKDENGKIVKNGGKLSVVVLAGETKDVEVGIVDNSLVKMASYKGNADATRTIKIIAEDASDDSKMLANTKYAITNTETGDVETAITNGAGVAEVANLQAGEYSVVELETPTGYSLSTLENTVDLTDVQTMTLSTTIEKGDSTKAEEKAILNQVMTTAQEIQTRAMGDGESTVVLYKVYKNEEGESVRQQGAGFELKNLDTGEVKNITTDEVGTIRVDRLEPGNYSFTETYVPVGYKAHPTYGYQEFELDYRDLVQVDVLNLIDDSGPSGIATMEKYDGTTGEALEGVEFSLLDEDKNEVETGLLTDENGEILVDGLDYGTYYWLETKALDDYILSTRAREVTVGEDSPGGYMMSNTLKVADITIEKVDSADDKIKLSGAVFSVVGPKDGSSIVTKSVTTGAEGTDTITDLAPGEYTVTEVTAPDGYQELEGDLTFTVARGGTEANENWVIENTEIGKYTVTYNGNGSTSGSVPTDGNEYLEDEKATVLGEGDLARDNHTFAAWNTKADGSGDGYVEGNEITMTAN